MGSSSIRPDHGEPLSPSAAPAESAESYLRAVAQIAAALATGDAPTEVLGGVLARIADSARATSCSLWLMDELELRCKAKFGAPPPPVAVVRGRLAAADEVQGTNDPIVVRLDAANHPLGALVVT